MSENTQPDLASQFRELGDNLKNVFQSAWESEEAQKLKEELKDGLTELGDATSQAVEDFKASGAEETIKAEAEDLKARVHSGEFEARTRDEISKALNIINIEPEWLYIELEVPIGTLPSLIATTLMEETAERALALDPSRSMKSPWSNGYLIRTPAESLHDNEIDRFVNFYRSTQLPG